MTYPAWVEGKATATVAVTDRGLQYGDGLFETLRTASTFDKAVLEPQHWARLERGLRLLGFAQPQSLILEAQTQYHRYLAEHRPPLVKVIVTRGSGGRGYQPPANAEPRILIQGYELPSYPSEYTVYLCSTALHVNPALAGIKDLNRLEQVLARQEFSAEYAEGLMANSEGQWVEGTSSNLCVIHHGVLHTAAARHCAIWGTMQEYLITLTQTLGFSHNSEVGFDTEFLHRADKVFLCNSVFGIRPVVATNVQRRQPGTLHETSETLWAQLNAHAPS